MEILKQGNKEKIKFRFTCPVCKCEYLAAWDECERQEDWPTDSIVPFYSCPCCGRENRGRVYEK